jgi:hypothetical protein
MKILMMMIIIKMMVMIMTIDNNKTVGYKIYYLYTKNVNQPKGISKENKHRKIDPYGTSSGSDNFQNNQNRDSQNSRSVILRGFYQILSSENQSYGYIENYRN